MTYTVQCHPIALWHAHGDSNTTPGYTTLYNYTLDCGNIMEQAGTDSNTITHAVHVVQIWMTLPWFKFSVE